MRLMSLHKKVTVELIKERQEQDQAKINTVTTELSTERLRYLIWVVKCQNTAALLDCEAVSVSLWPKGNFTLLSLILSFTLPISKHKCWRWMCLYLMKRDHICALKPHSSSECYSVHTQRLHKHQFLQPKIRSTKVRPYNKYVAMA